MLGLEGCSRNHLGSNDASAGELLPGRRQMLASAYAKGKKSTGHSVYTGKDCTR